MKLNFPINTKDGQITSIDLKRPTAGHMKRVEEAKKDGIASTLFLISLLSGHPPTTLEDLDVSDMTRLSKILESFSRGLQDEDGEP